MVGTWSVCWGSSAKRTGCREAIHYRSSMSALIRLGIDSSLDSTMGRLDLAVWCQLQCLLCCLTSLNEWAGGQAPLIHPDQSLHLG